MYDWTIEQVLQRIITIHDARLATRLGNSGDIRAVDALLCALQTPPLFPDVPEPIFRYYAVRALGRLGDTRAIPLLEHIQAQEVAPVLKGRSISTMAQRAIERIRTQTPLKTDTNRDR